MSARRVFFREGVKDAIVHAMDADPSVILIGQDLAAYGGAYREADGLGKRYGSRVKDMPVAEAVMVAAGIGAAAAGMRPVVFITYMDFLLLGLEPLVNFAAKLRYKTGGQLNCPVVIKATEGAQGQGVAHAQAFEAWLMSVPGLTVVAPSTVADAYGLLTTALRSDGPVVFVDHKRLYKTSGLLDDPPAAVPFGQARVARAGKDLVLVSHGYMASLCEEACTRLAAVGIDAGLVDLRSLRPLDIDTVCGAIAGPRRALLVEEGQLVCGVTAEIGWQVRERLGDVRLARLGPAASPVSSNPVLERLALPDVERITRAAQALVG